MKQIIRGAAWLASANGLSTILNFVQGIVITRALGTNQYGILVLVMTYAKTIRQLIDARNFEAAVKFIPQFQENGENIKAIAVLKLLYILDAGIAIISALIIFKTAQLAATLFVNNALAADLIKLYGVICVIDFADEVSGAVMRLNNQYKRLFYIEVTLTLFQTIGLLVTWLLGTNIVIVLLVFLASTICGTVLTQIMAFRTMRQMNLTKWHSASIWLLKGQFREIFRFVFFSYLTANSRLVTSKADILILGWFTNPAAVAFYELGKRVVEPITRLLASFSEIAYPKMSNYIARGQFQEVKHLQKRLTVLLLGLTIPICLIGSFAFTWIIPLVFGEEYLATIPLAQIFIWTLIWMPLSWSPGFLLALGKSHIVTMITALDALIFVILLIGFTSILGALGTAIAGILRMVIWMIITGRYVLQFYRTYSQQPNTPLKAIV